jgi:hypothetical protein
MSAQKIAPATGAPPAGAIVVASAMEPDLLPQSDAGSWTVRRREVIAAAAGVCTRCGMTGADTVIRGWVDRELVAVHTRCVVGLGPPDADRACPA